MTPEEIEVVKFAVKEICEAWLYGCVFLSIGIGCISIKNIIGKGEK